jgi:hypothetical protein
VRPSGPEAEVALFVGQANGHDVMFLGGQSAWVGGRLDAGLPVGPRVHVGASLPAYALQYERLTCTFGATCTVTDFVPFFPVFNPALWVGADVLQLSSLAVSPWLLARAEVSVPSKDPVTFAPEAVLGVTVTFRSAVAATAVVPAVAVSPPRWPLDDARLGAALALANHRFSLDAGFLWLAAGYTYSWPRVSLGLRWATSGTYGNTAELGGRWHAR